MKLKKPILSLAILGLLIPFVWSQNCNQPKLILAGKPPSYWLEHLPIRADDGLLDSDHPLYRAGPELIPFLIRSIDRDYTLSRWYGVLWMRAPMIVQHHLPKPNSPEGTTRCVAAFRLGQFGPVASNAVPSLIRLTERSNDYSGDRGRTVQALGFIGPPARESVPVLVRALTDSQGFVRQAAVVSLVKIGSVPRSATNDLLALMEEQKTVNSAIAGWAAVAIYMANPGTDTLARIMIVLRPRTERVMRAETAAALGQLEHLPEEAIPVLREMLRDSEPLVRHGAAIALARRGGDDLPRIIEVLIEGTDPDRSLAIPCVEALGRLGPPAKKAIPALERVSKVRGAVLSGAAFRAMENINSPTN